MTKKDYELIARAFHDQIHNAHWDGQLRSGIAIMADAMATFLGADSPKFDTEKFLRACGLDELGYPTGENDG